MSWATCLVNIHTYAKLFSMALLSSHGSSVLCYLASLLMRNSLAIFKFSIIKINSIINSIIDVSLHDCAVVKVQIE